MKRWVLLFLSLSLSLGLCGCWNYRELEGLATVTGVAVDRGSDGKWYLTAEIVDFSLSEGSDSSPKANLVAAEGETYFDAIRNMIEVSSQKLYWSHALTFIISKDVAQDGLIELADWISRNAELRQESVIIVSREDTARAVLNLQTPNNTFVGYALYTALRSMESVSKSAFEQTHELSACLSGDEESVVLPVVSGVEVAGKKLASVAGGAYFQQDRLAGFLSPDEMFAWSFVEDEAEGGILNVPYGTQETDRVALEIKKSKTKIEPKLKGSTISFKVSIDTQATVGDVETDVDIFDPDEQKQFVQKAQKTVEERCLSLIAKMQGEGYDIFGFGTALKDSFPSVWKKIEKDWRSIFKTVSISVKSKVSMLHFGESNRIISSQ